MKLFIILVQFNGGLTIKKVAIYSRKSVLVEGSVSIETQINMCKDYINNKFPNAKFKVFEDEGFSGGKNA